MHQYFAAALWRGILAQLMRPAGVLLFGLLLAAAAQAPAQACTEATARYVVRGQVERSITSNGVQISVPAGYAAGWSCASAAEAQAAFDRAAAQIGAPHNR